MDPPYKVESRRVFKEYSAMAFSREDVVALRSSMVTLDSRGIKFLVSYAVSAEADILSQGFNRQELRVRRNIAGFASARRDSREVFIYNYNL
jgi:DNA adenine methylase